MAYNNYIPQYYQPTPPYPQMGMSQGATSQNSGITWVQGENAAKSYPVAAGQSILLMDSENSVMYIKSTDQSGVPLPLRIFDYTERSQTPTNAPQTLSEEKGDYISRDEFDAFREEIRAELRQPKASVTTTKTSSKEK